MDTQTLVVANVLLFALYAGVMLMNARILGGARGVMWFAGANLCRGVSMLSVEAGGGPVAFRGVAQAGAGFFAVLGMMLLHQSFADLLEYKPLLRWVQIAMVGLIVAGSAVLLMFPSTAPVLEALLYLMLGVQTTVIAAVVFRFSGEDIGLAGWFTGVVLSAYAVVQVMRALVMTQYDRPEFPTQLQEINRVWLLGCLLSSGAIACGYLVLSNAKLRVELLWRAQVDELTGLLNRWALKRAAMREIHRCKLTKGSMSILMMDLDGLKEVNDTTGHGCGDVVLQSVAGVLQETLRAQDSVGRMGGDEFCVVLPDTPLVEAVMVAERLRAEVYDLVVQYRSDRVRVRASLGVTSSEISGLTWQGLVDDSDAALYRAKRDGKNRVAIAELESLANLSDSVFLQRKDVGRTATQSEMEVGDLGRAS
jgi:diguanylate cyclase (GGDEF)-like protein